MKSLLNTLGSFKILLFPESTVRLTLLALVSEMISSRYP